jgi:fermentation-respiration switch protein FrsA (DUF1100 family)
MKSVTFKNGSHMVAGSLFFPAGFDEKQTYSALICIHPGSSCKEQTSGIYAEKMAERGFVTLAFDASYQGGSGGEPRFAEYPAARVEDVRCAVDYLVTLPYVDEERIGVLGVCAGGGYAVNSAMTERRIKAVGAVAGVNIGRCERQSVDPIATLEAVGKQRTAEARGAAPLIVPWIPGSQAEREQAGLTDIDIVEAVDYYTTPRGQQPGSPNKMYFVSMAHMLAFDAFYLAEELLTQPLQIIVGDKQGAFGSYRDGNELYKRAASQEKDLYVLEGVSHYDLYDRPGPVSKAVDKLDAFYKKYL